MCGRFTLRSNAKAIAAAFDLAGAVPEFRPRYNVAPTQMIPVIRKPGELTLARWGLIPSWAKDEKIGYSLINARADGVADKPSFRSAFKRHRCLVVADGFYEWKKLDGKNKQPYFIHLKNDSPFAFAGLSEHWTKGKEPIDSATIITTDPNSLMEKIHDRMPVILPKKSWQVWLDPEFSDRDELLKMLKAYPAKEMVATPVSTVVNNPRNEKAECIEPVEV